MEIIGGTAKGMILQVPQNMEVRPTSVRSRRSLFDTLGDLSGKRVCDLFAGSGALGLEAASRGADHVMFVEKSPAVMAIIRKNIAKVEKLCPDTMFQVISGTVPACFRKMTAFHPKPDLIFADPPYAMSADLLDAILHDPDFCQWADQADMIWEMPDYCVSLKVFPPEWTLSAIKELGATRFLFIRKTAKK